MGKVPCIRFSVEDYDNFDEELQAPGGLIQSDFDEWERQLLGVSFRDGFSGDMPTLPKVDESNALLVLHERMPLGHD